MAIAQTPSADLLLRVIQVQTEIARLGADLGGVMALVAERTQALTRAAGAVIELAEGDDMVYRASSGIAESYLGLRLKRDNSLSGLCIRLGHPLRCDDSETDPRVDREACRRIGLRSMIVVPLRHHDQVVGVLKVLSVEPTAFHDEDLHMLGLMSDLVAAAMFHATQHESGALFHRATHDPLTGLPNRALFYERLRGAQAEARRETRRFAVMSVDMDGLKPINDSHGHRAGDAAICEVAARIRNSTRAADTVARLGGDEFGVILAQCSDRDGVQAHAQRLNTCVGADFAFEQHPLRLGASIGAAIYPDDGDSLETLLEAADQAMYVNKRAGRPAR
ncbi:sensor domain-containing diguanylate cyclase [Lysobacter solisilvae (ex Woo and Kim 2020)]|uniref:GGDEF domain-containing protein n=1 Tax=Agrilutibacter terrestris TaxID=2865112 RepID=A0A7H0FX15_9GAMM|nr:sensor domain-containing diguanylate cyclase [Lysobacter terrestris]QNP40581.1 GGDEF domain-containing protein [Lysobacter terrestris]